MAGQDDIFDHGDDEDDRDSSDEEFADASDVSMADAIPDGKVENSLGDSSAETSNEDDGASMEGPDEELAAFDAKLALALGTRPAADDLAATEEESSSDDNMNDEQMEALDEHLEKVFRERKNLASKRTRNKDAKEAIVNFKRRVLELLDIYVKQQHTNPLSQDLLVPLLNAIRTTKNPLVSTKACDVVRNYTKPCKPNSLPMVTDPGRIIELLREIHQEASKDGSKAYGSACSQASLLLVKILVAQDRENLGVVESVYGETHLRFLKGPTVSQVKASFFTDWLNWSVTARNG